MQAASRSQSANEGDLPRMSKRLDKSMADQMKTPQENSAAAGSKEMDSSTTGGGVRKRKSEDASILASNKKCTRARTNTIHVSRSDRSVSKKRCALIFEERCVQLLAFKDELGTAMFLVSLQAIHHWETFVAT